MVRVHGDQKTMEQNRINGMHDIIALIIVALILVAVFALLYKRRVKPGIRPWLRSAFPVRRSTSHAMVS